MDRDRVLETSLPFDKVKEKEALERKQRIKMANIFNT